LGGKTFEQVKVNLDKIPELEKRPTVEELKKSEAEKETAIKEKEQALKDKQNIEELLQSLKETQEELTDEKEKNSQLQQQNADLQEQLEDLLAVEEPDSNSPKMGEENGIIKKTIPSGESENTNNDPLEAHRKE